MKTLLLLTSIFIIVFLIGCNQSGPNGMIIERPGKDGKDGSNGYNAVLEVTEIPYYSILPTTVCPAGGYEYRSAIDTNENGTADIDEKGFNVSILCNGINGTNGQNAPPTPYTVTKMIDPCLKQGSNNSPDEVFMLLNNGQLIASFSQNSAGNLTRFSSLIPEPNSSFSGQTTDGTSCGITITRDGSNNISLTTSNGLGQASWTLEL